MAIAQERGKKGEKLACKYLKKHGYKILKRNYKCKLGEVDIIAQSGTYVAFIEVKTRTREDFGQPSEAVSAVQQRRYKNAAECYFYGTEPNFVIRFDVIEVYADDGYKINHIENAF